MCWRSGEAAGERPQGPGHSGAGAIGDGQRSGGPAPGKSQVRLPADAQCGRGVGRRLHVCHAGRRGTVRVDGHQDLAAPGDRRADADLPQLISRRRGVPARPAGLLHQRGHRSLQSATRQANIINRQQDLSGIRVGLHDEIFHGATPVLAGVDANSTYCYLLAAEQRRDADSWGVHLLDATQQGFDPDDTIGRCGARLARRAESRLGRHAVPWRRVPHPASMRRPRQQAGAPRQGRDVPAPDAGKPRPAAAASGVPTTSLPPSWRLHGRPRPRRMSWPAIFERSPSG